MGVAGPADAGLLLGLVALGVASGLVPVINAEALVTAAVVTRPDLWMAASVSVTCGQCAAKTLIYVTARDWPQRLRPDGRASRLGTRLRGAARRHGPSDSPEPRRRHSRRDRLLGLLRTPLPGTSLVVVSATLGLPPLALVSVLAGLAHLRMSLFVGACLAGRLVRFVAIAWPLAHLLTPQLG